MRWAIIRTIGGHQFTIEIGNLPFLQWWANVRLDDEVRHEHFIIRVAGIQSVVESDGGREARDGQPAGVSYLRPVPPPGGPEGA